MKRFIHTPSFYVKPKTFALFIPFISLIIIVVYLSLKPTTFNQPHVAAFEVRCAEFVLGSDGVDASLVPSEGYSEGSGMVASRKNPGIFWVHSDELLAGNHISIWAITATGEFIARYDFPAGLEAFDTEDIAIGPHPSKPGDFLYLGAFGDNDSDRGRKTLFRFEEPQIEQDTDSRTDILPLDPAQIETVNYTYPKVADSKFYDAEGLIVDPLSGDIFIFTKDLVANNGEDLVSFVFKLKRDDFLSDRSDSTLSLSPVAAIRGKTPGAKGKNGPTAADITFDGTRIAVVNRSEIMYWERPADKTIEETLINSSGLYGAPEPCTATERARNPESVAFSENGSAIYTISEKFNARIYKYDLR